MNKAVRLALILTVVFAVFAFIRCGKSESAKDTKNTAKSKTASNLASANISETNNSVKYAAYSKKADEEDMPGAACLFRALSKAEDIHAHNFCDILMKCGVICTPSPETHVVKNTEESLTESIKSEIKEIDVTYPIYMKDAQSENMSDAVKALTFASKSETEHLKILQYFNENKDLIRDSKIKFYVCPLCGSVTRDSTEDPCPVCKTSRAKSLIIE
jgi:rubrerythrin